VDRLPNIPYRDLYPDEDPEPSRNKLDIYLPRGRKDFPVVFFVHGGSWAWGSKKKVLWYNYGDVGKCFARHGIGAVMPNYRLSPAVRHPEHMKDVARAFAWTWRNIAKYGGRSDQLFVAGHSAGGHLVSLLATDPSYLDTERIRPHAIKGVISVAGVYRLPDFALDFWVRGSRAEYHLTFNPTPFREVFGDDPCVLRRASPVTHVRPGLPPFLVVTGGLDVLAPVQGTEEFCTALRDNQCEVRQLSLFWRTHESIVFNVREPDDPVAKAMVQFIREHCPANP
jgi:acetyl esterase/lipase